MRGPIIGLIALLFVGSAQAQTASSTAGVGSLLATPSYNGDVLSLANQAPRRTRMSLSLGSSLAPTYQTLNAGTIYTSQLVTPIEANAYAVRIGLAQPYSGNTQINSASVYFSDSYSGLVQGGVPGYTGNTTSIPTVNSVFQSCTTTNASATVVCSNTASFPSAATMYAIGTGIPVNATATVASGTNVTLSANATASGTVTLQFANIAPECKLYWDNAGADVDTINTAGTARVFNMKGNPANTGTGPYTFTLQTSDFVPCSSIARADGGTQPLAFIYVTLGSGTVSWSYGLTCLSPSGSGCVTANAYDSNVASIVGNRYLFVGRPWNNGGTDYADNPAGSGFTGSAIVPMVELQYLTDARGWNVLQVGDSISASPGNDNFSTPVYRACKLLSTPQAPCEWSSVAWGGTASAIYLENLRNNIGVLQPSAVVGQPISRNDVANLAAFQMLLSKNESYTQSLNLRLGFYGEFPFTTTVDGSAQAQADLATMRARLATISKTCQPNTGGQTCPMVPVLDPVPIVSRAALGGNPWDYLAMLNTANGATAAGQTNIPITVQGGAVGCLPGDILTDTTTAGVIKVGAVVTSATTTALTVPSNTVIGGGIVGQDQLVCSYSTWTGGFLTQDNTHPWNPAILLLQPAADTFVKQLLGLQ